MKPIAFLNQKPKQERPTQAAPVVSGSSPTLPDKVMHLLFGNELSRSQKKLICKTFGIREDQFSF